MIHQVLLSDRATRDLDDAYQWYAARAPAAAVDWYNGFIEALATLGNNPERCPRALEAEKLGLDIRQFLYGRQRSYRALFIVREQAVVVLHIRHTARREVEMEDLF
jgi:plasmid stabilization system protein ParE